ncbi:hypothetical protein MYX78_04335 [Acidobacteria bacterium AH-259-G07]|nr:hypothetical protein [Acidobacteria bacterium AH-259-G07]
MLEWYANLTFTLMIFYSIAIVASLILMIQVLLMLIGVGDDLDVDLDHTNGLGILSLRSVTGFFGGFGWTGVIALENGSSPFVATASGAIVGGVLMLSVAYLMRMLYSLRESGTIDYQHAIGQVGTVYLPIPPNQSGPGKIRVMIQGRLKVVTAYTKFAQKIASQKKVKVLELLDARTVIVEPLGAETEDEKEEPT